MNQGQIHTLRTNYSVQAVDLTDELLGSQVTHALFEDVRRQHITQKNVSLSL